MLDKKGADPAKDVTVIFTIYSIKLPMPFTLVCAKANFFLDLLWKIGDKMAYRNRGGLCSEMNKEPAIFEITGTQTFSASSRKARCIPSRYAALFRFGSLPASLWRRTDTGKEKGWFRNSCGCQERHIGLLQI